MSLDNPSADALEPTDGPAENAGVWSHDFHPGADALRATDEQLRNLDLMLDVPLDVAVELGRAQMSLADLLALEPGSVFELDRLPGEPVDMYVNGRLVARGEIVVVNETLAFRITDILPTAAES
jgi:flagellar motor switch protein FliN